MNPIWLAFSIDRSASTPVFEQICDAIRRQIGEGKLVAGTKLPPTRSFATELGVSRSTVVTAYDQLCAEGYIEGRQGAGYEVCDLGEVELSPIEVNPKPLPIDTTPETRIFRAGEPDMRLFPHRSWAKTVARLCRRQPEALIGEGYLFGNPDLRKAIAMHLADWRGVHAHPGQIIITAGASDGLDLCLRSLAEPAAVVAMEDPGYQPLRRLILGQGLQPSYLTLDEQGAVLPRADTRIAILTPSHQYPMGGAMTPQRRQAFLQWAKSNDSWVIEDDYDSEFRFAGRPIPAMAGFDGLNRTIYVGSFSKIFSNGLRMGYAIVPDTLVECFAQTLRRFGRKASQMPQAPLADFMSSGEFYRHLRRVRREYAKRRAYLVSRLKEDFGDIGWFTDHQAGMQIALHLPHSIPDQEVAHRAKQADLEITPLSYFCAQGSTINGVLLGFCGFDLTELETGLKRLRQILNEMS